MDGVLVDSSQQHERVLRRWALRHGLAPEQVLAASHGHRNVDLIQRFAPHANVDIELPLIASWADVEAYDVVALPGAAALLCGCFLSMPVAVVTSTTEATARTRLKAAGLPCPEHLVTAESVIHGKPHPAPYLRAAELLGLDIARCLVIEDAPAGVAAGRRAGALVAAILTTHSEGALQDAHLFADSVADLATRLGWGRGR